ncbi:hypothetical protein [Sinorhizobium meliloti]
MHVVAPNKHLMVRVFGSQMGDFIQSLFTRRMASFSTSRRPQAASMAAR